MEEKYIVEVELEIFQTDKGWYWGRRNDAGIDNVKQEMKSEECFIRMYPKI